MEKKQNKLVRFIWKAGRLFSVPACRIKFNYTSDKISLTETSIVLANHNTDWDPIMLNSTFKEYMSVVASEHIFRWGLVSKIIVALMDPISRPKGTTAAMTARDIVKKLKSGTHVAMFAEGNRSFTGRTGEIASATAKLVKISGAALVTYRFEGGYLTSPRWSKDFRKGQINGKIIGQYSSEEIKKMSVEEIEETISRDLYTDAYVYQREHMIPYKMKKILPIKKNAGYGYAQGLERVICLCPKCGYVGTLLGIGDTLSCSCGFSVKCDEYGFIKGEGAVADNVADWDEYQTKKLIEMIPEGNDCIFSDDYFILKEIFPNHKFMIIGQGSISLTKERFDFCGQSVKLEDISGFSLHGPQTIDMSCNGHVYEISSPMMRNTRKYKTVIDYLNS